MHNGELSARQSDTAPEARRRQIELYQAMTPGRRLEIALSMSGSARELALAGLQRIHPHDDDLALRIRLATLTWGPETGLRLRTALARRQR